MEIITKKKVVTSLIRPNYYIFRPVYVAGKFEDKWRSCFNIFKHFLKKNTNQKPFIIRVFIDAKNEQEFLSFQKLVKQSFWGTNIPITIIPQSPEDERQVILEVGFVNKKNVCVKYGKADLLNYCKLSIEDYSEYWITGTEEDIIETCSIPESANNEFNKLHKAFTKLGLGFNNIVRQWNYIESIYGFQEINGKLRQHYQLFNEVRGKFYLKYRNIPDFPAATGIGKAFCGTSIVCMLVGDNSNMKIIPISNPQQFNSYKYGQIVLKGEPPMSKTTNQPPQFERAKLITNGERSRIFISGTASIIGQRTIGLGDVEKQTQITIDNINLLTSKANLKEHYPELTVFPDKFAYVGVYVKHKEHIPKVKAMCLEHFGPVPMNIVVADICREDLLVEIEAEKIS